MEPKLYTTQFYIFRHLLTLEVWKNNPSFDAILTILVVSWLKGVLCCHTLDLETMEKEKVELMTKKLKPGKEKTLILPSCCN